MVFALAWSLAPLIADAVGAPSDFRSVDDDFNPGVGIFAAFMILFLVVALMLLLGVGLVVGIVLCLLAGGLAAFGILSSSVAVGFVRRSPASGFRALILQVGAAAGIPCGIAAAWLAALIAHSHWSATARLLAGATGGLLCGVAVAVLFNFAWGRIAALIIARQDRRQLEIGNLTKQ